jgi:hypothetical protein
MAEATEAPKPKLKPRVPADPVVTQRAVVYTLLGLLCLTGLAIAMAIVDPCKKYGGEEALAMVGKRCKNVVQFRDYLPGTPGWVALATILVVNIVVYELRWIIRIAIPIAVGALALVVAGVVLWKDQPGLLAVFYVLYAVSLFACAVGIQRNSREGWAFALSLLGVGAVAHFFGAAKLQTETGWSMAYAMLPGLAVLLPAFTALACTPIGGKRYAPFATKPSG